MYSTAISGDQTSGVLRDSVWIEPQGPSVLHMFLFRLATSHKTCALISPSIIVWSRHTRMMCLLPTARRADIDLWGGWTNEIRGIRAGAVTGAACILRA